LVKVIFQRLSKLNLYTSDFHNCGKFQDSVFISFITIGFLNVISGVSTSNSLKAQLAVKSSSSLCKGTFILNFNFFLAGAKESILKQKFELLKLISLTSKASFQLFITQSNI
jgi:hypothetical protein